MKSVDELFDKKMKEQFKKETEIVPKDINDEFEKILESERNKERFNMGKLKRFGITAASIVCVGTLVMQTAFAQDIVDKIIKSLSINGLTVYEGNTGEDIWARDMPEAAKGKVFDAEGNVVEKINKDNMEYLYNKDGEHVWVDDEGIILTDEEMDERIKKNNEEHGCYMLEITDLNELDNHITFKAKLPEYIPEGFEFVKAECEDYDKANIINKIHSRIVFGKNKSYWYQLIYENKETNENFVIHIAEQTDQGETSFNNIEMGKVNGNDAIVSDGEVAWSDGENEYIVFMHDLGREEGIKIAESIK